MLVMRRREPRAERKFKTPLAWIVGPFGILGCLYLFYSLPRTTQIYFLCAHVVGLILYFAYGARRSVAGREAAR
jgi:APA family basic amino acid/polyamine antiporter